MTLGVFAFPPIDELFRWKDIVFEGTSYAINKTSLLVIVSSLIILAIFVGGSRRMKLVPRGLPERARDDLRVRRPRHHARRDRQRRDPVHAVPRVALPLHPVPELLGSHPVHPVPADVAVRDPAVPVADGLRHLLVPGLQAPGIKYLTGHLFPAGVPLAAVHPRHADRARADPARPALLAGGPTSRQHDGGPHPAHRARAAHRLHPRRTHRSSRSVRSRSTSGSPRSRSWWASCRHTSSPC